MALKLVNDDLFTSSGEFLKTISCPKNVDFGSLKNDGDGNYVCKVCTHTVFDTDTMSEHELVSILRANPKACLKINLANPLFERDRSMPNEEGSDHEN